MNAIQLRRMIMDAAEHVPFYRRHWKQAGVDLTRIHSSVPLEFLPVVTRADLLNCPPEDRLDQRYRGVTVDKGTLHRQRARFWHALRDVGYVPGQRVMIISDESLPTGASLLRWTRVDTSLDDEAMLTTYSRVRPSVLYGPLSLLSRLAARLAASSEPVWQPRVLVSTAEQLTDAKRVLLESTFGAKVADFYFTPEQGLIAYSRPGLPGYRSIDDEFVIESLHATPGKGPGRLIVTDLVSGAMPLIRFDTGDFVTRDFAARGITFAPAPIASFSQREPVKLDRKSRPAVVAPERDRAVSGLDAGELPGALSA